jgi:hypothetical protein
MQATTTCTLQRAATALPTRELSAHHQLASCCFPPWHVCTIRLVGLVLAGLGLTSFVISRLSVLDATETTHSPVCDSAVVSGGTRRPTVEDIGRTSGSHTVSHGALAD